jgi:nicotinamidase-related amidase
MRPIIDNRHQEAGFHSPADTALLCIHWQNDIVQPDGGFGDIFASSVRQTGALENTVSAVRACRSLGVPVIHVLASYDPEFRGHVTNNALFRTVQARKAFVRGTRGVQVCDELRPESGELLVEHTRINCFYGTDLSTWLRSRGIINLAFTGVATNVAVDHSVREAVQAGFNTYLLDDCCCSSTPEYHDAAMLTLAALSTHVMKHEEFLKSFKS